MRGRGIVYFKKHSSTNVDDNDDGIKESDSTKDDPNASKRIHRKVCNKGSSNEKSVGSIVRNLSFATNVRKVLKQSTC